MTATHHHIQTRYCYYNYLFITSLWRHIRTRKTYTAILRLPPFVFKPLEICSTFWIGLLQRLKRGDEVSNPRLRRPVGNRKRDGQTYPDEAFNGARITQRTPYQKLCNNCVWRQFLWQETQLPLTNRATHLYKCNDVADLTSVIKIRLKKVIPRIRPFKVTQGHWNRHESTRHRSSVILVMTF